MPKKPRTQKTQPKKGDPIEIPVPERREVMGDLKKLAKRSIVRRTSTSK